MGSPRQEHWRGLLLPSPWALPDTGIKPGFPALEGGFFTTEPPGKPTTHIMHYLIKQKRSRKWHLTPVFLPGEHRQRILVSYSPWGSQRVGQDWSNLAQVQSGKTNLYLKGTQEKGKATMQKFGIPSQVFSGINSLFIIWTKLFMLCPQSCYSFRVFVLASNLLRSKEM